MPVKPRVLESVLLTKFGFAEAPKKSDDHRWFELRLEGVAVIMTKVSHSTKDIGKGLEGAIAKQLRADKQFFRGMISCSNDRDSYYARVRAAALPPENANRREDSQSGSPPDRSNPPNG